MDTDPRLDDLAALFIGLAHGIDRRMHFNEFTGIAALLERWRHPGDRRDVVSLVDQTVQEFDPIRVIESIENLGRTLSEREKRRILEELSEIALADRTFLKVEAEYIGRVAFEWRLQPTGEDRGAFWTVFRARNVETARAAALDLATLYIAAAIEPDGDLSDAEFEAVTARVAQWVPDLPTGPVDDLVRAALAGYESPLDREALQALVTRIRKVLPDHQVEALTRDLRAIAQADGAYTVESRGWIDRIEGMLG